MKSLRSGKRIGSLLPVLLLYSCIASDIPLKPVPKPYMVQSEGALVYNTSFSYKDFQASGLLVMKRLQESEYHVVLLSKFGPSLMEFKLNEDELQWIKTFEQLEKRSVQKMIERDFRLILLSDLDNPDRVKELKEKENAFVYQVNGDIKSRITVNADNNQVVYAENRGLLNLLKTRVSFFYAAEDIPDSIAVTHRNVDMSLHMKRLKKKDAER